jgi:uracil-DNA glycosylase
MGDGAEPRRAAGGEDAAALAAEIGRCRLCAARFAATATAHAPRPVVRLSATARVLVVGQAPGARVHASGLPFDDASGDRLRGWMGLDRATFYDAARVAVAPMAFCFPGYDAKGSDLPPPPVCAATWRARVEAALPAVEFTLLIGAHAQRWGLGPRAAPTMAATVAGWRDLPPHVLPLPHPSWRNTGWLSRNPWFEAEVVPALRARLRPLLS